MDIHAWNVKKWNVLKSLAVTTFCKKEKKESSDLWVLLSFLKILTKLTNLNNVQMWIDCVWVKDKHGFNTKCRYFVCSMIDTYAVHNIEMCQHLFHKMTQKSSRSHTGLFFLVCFIVKRMCDCNDNWFRCYFIHCLHVYDSSEITILWI